MISELRPEALTRLQPSIGGRLSSGARAIVGMSSGTQRIEPLPEAWRRPQLLQRDFVEPRCSRIVRV